MPEHYAVHYPKNPARSEFDEEVSAIFPDMARRAIPMYAEAHRLHVSLLHNILAQPTVTICDIGASRGGFFKEICNQFQIPEHVGAKGFNFIAVDSSRHMMEHLHKEMPWITTVVCDAQQMVDLVEPADIICLFYILQFIESEQERMGVLRWAYRNLREGGVLILGQKEKVPEALDEVFSEEYYCFRERNGYSRAEIVAKTAALKNSMWPISPEWLEAMCYEAKFSMYAETTKWLQFSTSICVK